MFRIDPNLRAALDPRRVARVRLRERIEGVVRAREIRGVVRFRGLAAEPSNRRVEVRGERGSRSVQLPLST